jgi:membrane protein DedA with SNARE-associated domain
MAESQFSWFKVASFVGATLLAVICFVAVAAGFNLYHEGQSFVGIMCAIAGVFSGACAVMVYKNYQKKSRKQ